MNQFVQRVANYIANEIFVKGLANSKTFQKFAVRTDHTLRQMRQGGEDSINARLDEFHKAAQEAAYSSSTKFSEAASKASSKMSGPPIPPKKGFPGFISALGKEIKKDLGIGK